MQSWRRGRCVAGLAFRRIVHLAAVAAFGIGGGDLVNILLRRIAEPTFLQQLLHPQKQICPLSDPRVKRRWVFTAGSVPVFQQLPDLDDLVRGASDGKVDIDMLPVVLRVCILK